MEKIVFLTRKNWSNIKNEFVAKRYFNNFEEVRDFINKYLGKHMEEWSVEEVENYYNTYKKEKGCKSIRKSLNKKLYEDEGSSNIIIYFTTKITWDDVHAEYYGRTYKRRV